MTTLSPAVPTGNLIAGAWVQARSGATFPVLNPATDEALCEVPDCDVVDGLSAVDAAYAAGEQWAATAPRVRAEVLRKSFELMIERREEIRQGELVIDEATYTAKLHGRSLDLTFKEFELLKFLAQSPGRVFSRAQLLQEVWGYDYFGGTRTVDVHVRRLRMKLGSDFETLIGTVRNVGYRFETEASRASALV